MEKILYLKGKVQNSNSKDAGRSHIMEWGKIYTYRKNNNKSTWWAQQKNLFNIISGNFEISKQQIAELKKEINELKQSIAHTENVLEDKLARVDEY